MALYYPTSKNAVQKTLDAQLLAGATTSMTLNNVVGIQNKAGVCVIDRVDANGTATSGKREYVAFTGVSGSTLTGLTRNADSGGTDQDHAVGAIVEFVSDALQQQAIIDGLLKTVDTDGALLKATGAEINTGTEDAKIVTPKAIADSNVVLTTKTQTLTNKTLTSPKINEDVALTSTATELNALDGQTVAWTTYTPTLTNITLGDGILDFGYCKIGKTVHVSGRFVMAANSSINGLMGFSLPVAAVSDFYSGTVGTILDVAAAFIPCVIYFGSTTRMDVYALNAAGTYLAYAATSSSVPMTWTNPDALTFYLTYEAA